MTKEPKTPHEEIMFCIESNNDIISKILGILEKDACYNKKCLYRVEKE